MQDESERKAIDQCSHHGWGRPLVCTSVSIAGISCVIAHSGGGGGGSTATAVVPAEQYEWKVFFANGHPPRFEAAPTETDRDAFWRLIMVKPPIDAQPAAHGILNALFHQ
uniref:Uncharacterized protein n=1 Tax=Anopheles atroparvus TaxID=41427 RepID=A0A182ITM7_ANOAO